MAKHTVGTGFQQKHGTTGNQFVQQIAPMNPHYMGGRLCITSVEGYVSQAWKAFDTIGRTGLWQLLRKYGCHEKFTTIPE